MTVNANGDNAMQKVNVRVLADDAYKPADFKPRGLEDQRDWSLIFGSLFTLLGFTIIMASGFVIGAVLIGAQ